MTFLTRKHLPRRTFLRGAGAAVALPFLDSMVPAQTRLANTAATPKTRLNCIYVPHGATMDRWTPAQEGTGFEFSEILKPLEKFRDHINVLSNLAHPEAGGAGGDAGGDHARSAAVFLSGVHPEKGTVHLGETMDQIAAQTIGQDTPLPSIELSLEEVSSSCDAGYACAYYNTIAWKNTTLPLPMENSPQNVFEMLFGDGSTVEQRLQRKKEDSSILDSVMSKTATLRAGLGAGDRARLSEYLDGIREIERRIQKAEGQSQKDVPEAPIGIPPAFDDHIKLMYDLIVLAYRADITRVSTMMYARDTSGAVYPLSGVRDGFHTCSHHSNIRAKMDIFAKINQYHVQTFAYFLDKLQSTPDGDGTLLDHSLLLYGSSMSNGNQHDHDPLPVILAGGASGKLKGGRHITYAPHTRMANLLLSMLDKLGVERESIGNSTGKLEV